MLRRFPRVASLESLEPRVLLNADVGGFRQPASEPFLLLPGPPAAEMTGPMPDLRPSETVDRGEIMPFAGPLLVSRLAALSNPAWPTWTGPASSDAIYPQPAGTLTTAAVPANRLQVAGPGIQLADIQGNTRSSDDGLNLEGRLGFAASTLSAEESAPHPSEMMAEPAFPVGPPSPQELGGLTKIPWTRAYSYNGSMDASQASMAFRIPVGPNTQTLTIDVHADNDGQPFAPKVDQLYLLGPRGEMLAAIAGVMYMTSGNGQTLFITLHGAPNGGELVLRVVKAPPSPVSSDQDGDVDGDDDGDGEPGEQTPIGGEGSLSNWGNASFELSILRDDSIPRTSISPSVGTSTGTFVTILPVTPAFDTSTGTTAYTPDSYSTDPEGVSTSRVADGPRADRESPDFESLAEEPAAVFLGPLASRTAAPLGPVLATISGDPTPSTDRAARGDADPLDVLGANLDLDLILNLRFRSSARARSVAASVTGEGEAAVGTLDELRTPIGIPILVAGSRPRDAREEAEALAANLQRHAEEGELMAQASGPGAPIDDPHAEAVVARAGLATRAMGFLIGIGIASGPLYPDLVALARRKILRRKRPGRRTPRPRD